jgi:hypothetical protein
VGLLGLGGIHLPQRSDAFDNLPVQAYPAQKLSHLAPNVGAAATVLAESLKASEVSKSRQIAERVPTLMRQNQVSADPKKPHGICEVEQGRTVHEGKRLMLTEMRRMGRTE